MPRPAFATRVARIPELLAFLAAHPDGVSLMELARRFQDTPARLREDLTVYLDLESWGWSFDIFRRSQIELDAAEGEEAQDPASTIVRVVSTDPIGLGVEHLSANDLAVVYQAGMALLDNEPDNELLVRALEVVSETMHGESDGPPRVPDWHRFLPLLRQAQQERRLVRVIYSRAWYAGVVERDVEVYRLIQTHRGWEADAGPLAPDDTLRTYLVPNLRDVRLLDETFAPPFNLDLLLQDQRRTTTVRVELLHDARWAADMYAEAVTVVEDHEESFVADLELLPPVGHRLGLLLLASGPTSRILEPGSVTPEAIALIEDLVEHHSD